MKGCPAVRSTISWNVHSGMLTGRLAARSLISWIAPNGMTARGLGWTQSINWMARTRWAASAMMVSWIAREGMLSGGQRRASAISWMACVLRAGCVERKEAYIAAPPAALHWVVAIQGMGRLSGLATRLELPTRATGGGASSNKSRSVQSVNAERRGNGAVGSPPPGQAVAAGQISWTRWKAEELSPRAGDAERMGARASGEAPASDEVGAHSLHSVQQLGLLADRKAGCKREAAGTSEKQWHAFGNYDPWSVGETGARSTAEARGGELGCIATVKMELNDNFTHLVYILVLAQSNAGPSERISTHGAMQKRGGCRRLDPDLRSPLQDGQEFDVKLCLRRGSGGLREAIHQEDGLSRRHPVQHGMTKVTVTRLDASLPGPPCNGETVPRLDPAQLPRPAKSDAAASDLAQIDCNAGAERREGEQRKGKEAGGIA